MDIKTNWTSQEQLSPSQVNRIEGNIKTAYDEATEARLIAEGRSRALVFETFEQLELWIDGTYTRPDGKTTADLLPGDNLWIVALNVPDYWWDGTDARELETEKVDLTDYPKTSEVQDMIAALANNLLQKDNTTTYTPTGDYHPATKKYVDDNKGLELPPSDGYVYAIRNGEYIKITGAVWYEGM